MTPALPLLTIAIPTWNRASYLALNLKQIGDQLAMLPTGVVEVIVSNNASTDNTAEVVETAIKYGTPIRSITNPTNIGSDANIAQCFNLAKGKYVIILGDDDLFIDGGIALLLRHLEGHDYGVVTLRPYGYDNDFRREFPGGSGRNHVFENPAEFLAAIGQFMALISACVINKSLLPNVDAAQFCGCSLVQTHLVILAALAAKENLYLYRYLIAYKRNNWGAYDFAGILVTSLMNVIDAHKNERLSTAAIAKIENRLLRGFYPFYLFRQRLGCTGDLHATKAHFDNRFRGHWLYDLGVAPILNWPRPFALVWGSGMTVIGRILSGDLRRGLMFTLHKFFK